MGKQNNNLLNQHISGNSIDLRYYISVIDKNKWRILLRSFALSIISAFVVHNMTSVYRSTATLLIEANQAKAVSFDEIVRLDSDRKEYYSTQFEIIKSKELAREVVTLLNLKEHPDFLPKESYIDIIRDYLPFIPTEPQFIPLTPEEIAESEEFKLQRLINIFSKRLSIEPISNTQLVLVNISYESPDSKLSARVANAVGDTYIN